MIRIGISKSRPRKREERLDLPEPWSTLCLSSFETGDIPGFLLSEGWESIEETRLVMVPLASILGPSLLADASGIDGY